MFCVKAGLGWDIIAGVKQRLTACLTWCAVAVLPLAGQSAGVGSVRRLDPAFDNLIPAGAVIEKVTCNLQFA